MVVSFFTDWCFETRCISTNELRGGHYQRHIHVELFQYTDGRRITLPIFIIDLLIFNPDNVAWLDYWLKDGLAQCTHNTSF